MDSNLRTDDFTGLLAALGRVGKTPTVAAVPTLNSLPQTPEISSVPSYVSTPSLQQFNSNFPTQLGNYTSAPPQVSQGWQHQQFGSSQPTFEHNQIWTNPPMATNFSAARVNESQVYNNGFFQGAAAAMGLQQAQQPRPAVALEVPVAALQSGAESAKLNLTTPGDQLIVKGSDHAETSKYSSNWVLIIGALIVLLIVLGLLWVRGVKSAAPEDTKEVAPIKKKQKNDIKNYQSDDEDEVDEKYDVSVGEDEEEEEDINDYDASESIRPFPPPSSIERRFQNKKDPSTAAKKSVHFDAVNNYVQRNFNNYVSSSSGGGSRKQNSFNNEGVEATYGSREKENFEDSSIDLTGQDFPLELPEFYSTDANERAAAIKGKKIVAEESPEVLDYAKRRENLFKGSSSNDN